MELLHTSFPKWRFQTRRRLEVYDFLANERCGSSHSFADYWLLGSDIYH